MGKPRYALVTEPNATKLLEAVKLLITAHMDMEDSLFDCFDQLNINRSFFSNGTRYFEDILSLVDEALGEE